MSHKFLSATAAGILLLAAPSLAAAATEPVHHASNAKPAAKAKMTASKTMSKSMSKTAPKTAPAKTASAKTAATKTAATKTASMQSDKVHHHKMAKSEHRRKTAENESPQAAQEVRALNTLESAGYRRFNNLHASGTDYVATAMKAGKSYDVTVTPAGQIEATKA